MTLAERRIVNEFETIQFPRLRTRVEEAAGFAVPVEVQWDTLSIPGESRLYAESWPLIYFEPLIGALHTVTRDEMGRDAIKTGLAKVVIQNVKRCTYGDCWTSFQDGVLTLDHEATTNTGAADERQAALVVVLENSL